MTVQEREIGYFSVGNRCWKWDKALANITNPNRVGYGSAFQDKAGGSAFQKVRKFHEIQF